MQVHNTIFCDNLRSLLWFPIMIYHDLIEWFDVGRFSPWSACELHNSLSATYA